MDRQQWAAHIELTSAMFNWIASWYRPQQPHTSLGKLPPLEFEPCTPWPPPRHHRLTDSLREAGSGSPPFLHGEPPRGCGGSEPARAVEAMPALKKCTRVAGAPLTLSLRRWRGSGTLIGFGCRSRRSEGRDRPGHAPAASVAVGQRCFMSHREVDPSTAIETLYPTGGSDSSATLESTLGRTEGPLSRRDLTISGCHNEPHSSPTTSTTVPDVT